MLLASVYFRKPNPLDLPVCLSRIKFISSTSPNCEKTHIMSPSESSVDSPPIKIQAWSSNFLCQLFLVPAIPLLSSSSLIATIRFVERFFMKVRCTCAVTLSRRNLEQKAVFDVADVWWIWMTPYDYYDVMRWMLCFVVFLCFVFFCSIFFSLSLWIIYNFFIIINNIYY